MLGAHGQRLYGTVPDGVATVTLRYRRGSVNDPANRQRVRDRAPMAADLAANERRLAFGRTTVHTFQVARIATTDWFGATWAPG
jgi:hypothetical protein